MAESPKKVTRNQLAEFLPDPRAVRAFELLLKQVSDLLPSDVITINRLIEEAGIEGANATALVNAALSMVNDLSEDMAATDAVRGAQVSQLNAALARIADAIELISLQKVPESNNSISTDYIDFTGNPPHTNKVRRLVWNTDEETLDIHHNADVTQQVGYELYAFVRNNTGASLPDGKVISLSGSDGSYPTAVKFIANGTIIGQSLLGVLTETIPNGGVGRCNIYGLVRAINASGSLVGEVWAVGDAIYASPTTAGEITKVKPTAPNLAIPLGFVVNNSATVGAVFVRPVIEQQKFFGQFSKTSNVSPLAINTAYAAILDNTLITSGVTLGSPASRIVTANAGLYSFTIALQLASGSASVKNVWVWFRKNGVDVANTASKISLESATALATPYKRIFISMAASDYMEIMYAADSTNVTLTNVAATAFAPAAPALVVNVDQIQQ